MRKGGLTPRQTRFVDEYLIDLNATAAYKRAGYKGKAESLENNASRLMGSDGVSQAIAERLSQRSERTEVTSDWVLKRLKEEADEEGEGASHGARIRALELLGKHLGMFVDRVEVKQTATLEIIEEIIDAGHHSEADHSQNGKAPSGTGGILPV